MEFSLASQGNNPAIQAIENALLTLPQGDHLLEHYFIPGVYVRVLHIPAGTALTGRIHTSAHISILAHGTILLANAEGAARVSAPMVVVDPAGNKKLGYAETDCTFINVFRTDLTDIDELENNLAVDTFKEFEQMMLGELPL